MSFTSRMRLAFGVLLAFALLAACATRPPAIVLLDPARQASVTSKYERSSPLRSSVVVTHSPRTSSSAPATSAARPARNVRN